MLSPFFIFYYITYIMSKCFLFIMKSFFYIYIIYLFLFFVNYFLYKEKNTNKKRCSLLNENFNLGGFFDRGLKCIVIFRLQHHYTLCYFYCQYFFEYFYICICAYMRACVCVYKTFLGARGG